MGPRPIVKGPHTLGEWLRIYAERDSDTEYVTEPGERMVWDAEHGFFTFMFDPLERLILIPKMCGDGKYWRKAIYEMYLRARGGGIGVRGVYCCTKRNPKAYMRILGGELVKQETKENGQVISYILITGENTKERGGG
jgi:hypothetical protein